MSACLFIVGLKGLEESSIEDIKEAMSMWKEVTDSYAGGGANSFENHRYSGYTENLVRAFWYLKGYERARDES